MSIFKDRLIIKGPENKIHVCDVRKILNGPPEQTISQVSTHFKLYTDILDAEDQGNTQTIVSLGETNVIKLRHSEKNMGKVSNLQVYDFLGMADNIEQSAVKIMDFDVSADDKMFPHSATRISFERLPRNLIAVGYYFQSASADQTATQPKSGIRMMLFHYRQSSSEVVKIADNHFGIEVERFAQLPSYSSSGDNGCKRIIFGFYKQRVFCLAGVHLSKIATQIYCFYLNRFIPIGGTNCRTPGLYVLTRNHEMGFMNDTCYGGLYGLGCITKIDRKQRAIHYKFFEMRICF